MAQPPWTTSADPGRNVHLDTRTLRAMAHPVRVTLLRMLRTDGPSTATRLAERLGLNSGATSYHLRQLASAGLLIEDERRGTGRDRWWRAALRTSYFDPAVDAREGSPGAGTGHLNAIAAAYAERLQQAAHDLATLPDEWRGGVNVSDFRLRLTPEEVEELLAELVNVIARYRRDGAAHVMTGEPEPQTRHGDESLGEVPAGARPIVLQVQSFPVVEARRPESAP